MRQNKNNSDRITVIENSSPLSDQDSVTPAKSWQSFYKSLNADEKQTFARAAWQDMRQRHSKGERVRAEDYLPNDHSKIDEDVAVDLIYGEYVLRTESGEIPIGENYVERFPAFAGAIKRQFDVHGGFESLPADGASGTKSASDVYVLDNPIPGPLPATVGKYMLLTALSSGGQADVYRAVHPTLGRELVVKLSRRSIAEDSPAASRLLEEGRILADFDHPNLVRVYDMGLHFGYPYIAMEYVRGRTLEQFMQEEKIAPLDVARLVSIIAAAVAAAHAKNVLHLDLKPKNVLIDEQGGPRVVDFGLSRMLDAFREQNAPTVISGTIQYMAPEQARADSSLIGRRTDVFALGGVLYFMLTGKVPFPGTIAIELLPRVASGEWDREPLNSAPVPNRLKAICSRAMALSVDDRYNSADELATTLDRYTRYVRLRAKLIKTFAFVTLVSAVIIFGIRLIPAAVDVRPTLVANVRQPDGHFVELAQALPLHKGDELKIHAQVPAGVHAGLFLFNSSGELEQLASWKPTDEPIQVQYPPAAGATAPLGGRPGTEFLFLCTDSTEPITLEEVRKTWQSFEPLEPLPSYSIAIVDFSGVRFDSFGRGLDPAVHHDDPQAAVQRRLEPVLKELKTRFSGVAGLAFTHKR